MSILWTKNLPATGLDWRYTFGEVLELIEELRSFNLSGIISELCDVYTCVMCSITTSTDISIPLFWTRSANEWLHRADWVKNYLNELNLEFKIEYLRYGGNYRKADKRRMFVRLAVKDQLGLDLKE